ncbi:MAG: PaaI family thioesterase [Syntrophomonadaceae bacterium]|nr:PaaI family thioesterase [Syntrophomonadaceae bacterium]
MFNKSSKQPNSRSCFVCGRENEVSLKMSWYNDEEKQLVWSELMVPAHFNGYPGVVHGGIIAAILDETSGRALLINGDNDALMLTTHLELKYRRPTPTDQPLIAVGWIEKGGTKHARVAGELRLPDGTVTAECKATVLKPPSQFLESHGWQEEKAYFKVYND